MAAALQAKVKHVADAIWAKLSGVFSKEVLHAQHVSVFCHILQVTFNVKPPLSWAVTSILSGGPIKLSYPVPCLHVSPLYVMP